MLQLFSFALAFPNSVPFLAPMRNLEEIGVSNACVRTGAMFEYSRWEAAAFLERVSIRFELEKTTRKNQMP
jgi:hypothetical protein